MIDAAPSPDACAWATYYADRDGDGHGDPAASLGACEPPGGYVLSSDDCHDACATCFPGSAEVCDGVDQNCDGSSDSELYVTFYRDADGDGYGAGAPIEGCTIPAGYVGGALDCDDGASTVHPLASEACDGVDQDCDARTDEGVTTDYFPDCDGDGYTASDAVPTAACARPTAVAAVCGASDGVPGWSSRSSSADCFDASRFARPGATAYYDTGYAYRGVTSYDYNCDGRQEPRVARTGSADATCAFRIMPDRPSTCVASGENWVTAVPDCGATGQLRTCDARTCVPVLLSTRSACR